ncbi:general transcription factor II-I repeat domain-containing protein 2A [Trichonephila clavipes]|nr:general transcription factor II-I repeat domain-containing protein 2A [Trichonephila clavipes]
MARDRIFWARHRSKTICILADFDNKDKIIQHIKHIPLSRNTIKGRILKQEENVTDQQKKDINSTSFISLCLDESIDITKPARLAVFARYWVGNVIKEELIAITSLLTTTKCTDICTTALNKRKFDALLDEVNSVYNGSLMYNNVRWLSRENVFQRYVDCLEERLFLQNESKIEQYSQLMNIMWLLKLMPFTDICQHFNELNEKLQDSNKTVIVMIDLIRTFEAKLHVFRDDIITRNCK